MSENNAAQAINNSESVVPTPSAILIKQGDKWYHGGGATGGVGRLSHVGNGGDLVLNVTDMVYYIEGYKTITIALPGASYYTAHLFVTFPETTDVVGFNLPEGLQVSGHDPSTAASGDKWEVNIDSVGGALFYRKQAIV